MNEYTMYNKYADIPAITAICGRRNLKLIVDNTFLTPYWQKPLELGANIVVHNATKKGKG
ncbi:PLP-dependent transferase [Sporomusa ovata]